LDLLVRAARPLVDRHPNLTFEVAGEGPERPVLEELIRSYNLESHFLLRGAVSDIPGFLAELDIAVLPSRSESMSNALLEAMAAGRAIVATRVGAASQLIRPGVDGLLIEPESIPALVEAIDYLVRHAEESRNMGMSARERVTAHHSRKVMCHRFEQFYEELVWGDGRTGPVLLNSTAPVHCEPIGGV
jgi:glycosyltransferase involved in cell wall biosynthesis